MRPTHAVVDLFLELVAMCLVQKIPQDQGSQGSAGVRHRPGKQCHPDCSYDHVRMSGGVMVACPTLGPSLDWVIGEIYEEIGSGRLRRNVLSRGDPVGCRLALGEGL